MLSFFIHTVSEAQVDESDEDRTLAPYFIVLTDDPTIDQLPLKSTKGDVHISGVIANVQVTQVYKNNGLRPIEAIYVFPLSTNAAVYAMRMFIGDVMIEAEIKEKEEARQEYEEAKEEGKSASLLEQNRPNVFQMNVANIMPGDEITVELNYVETLVPENGVYEFNYPAVVGPRYSEKKVSETDGTESWIETPYQHEGEEALYEFDVNTHINSGVPLQSIESPSHNINIVHENETSADITLTTTEGAGLKDYRLRFSLRGNEIQTGVLLYEGEEENFFLAIVEPPETITEAQIPPREYLFVLDISGSMYGFPLDTAKTFLLQLLQELRPTDVFNVMSFAGSSWVMFENSMPAVSENIEYALEQIYRLQGGGSTQILQALQRIFDLPLYSKNLARSTVVITDGYVVVEYEVFDEIREHLDETNVFAAGIGSSPNRYIIEGMAHVGLGEPFFISKPEEVDETIERYKNYIKEPLLTHINVEFDGFNAYDVEPVAIPDVFAQRPVVIYGKYEGEPNGSIILTGHTADGEYRNEISITPDLVDETNSALRYLWARKRIQLLGDYVNLTEYALTYYLQAAELKESLTQLGLKYNLLTEYTSFIAVYHEVRYEDGEPVVVEQPLPLPEGVEDSALPSPAPSPTPAPGHQSVPVNDWFLHDDDGDGMIDEAANPATIQGNVLEIIDLTHFRIVIDGIEQIVQLKGIEIADVNSLAIQSALNYLKRLLVGQTILLRNAEKTAKQFDGQPLIRADILIDGINIVSHLQPYKVFVKTP